MITHRDTRMHRVCLEVPTDCGMLLENVYEHFTRRRFYLFGWLPIWEIERDIERRPMHEFIRNCIG